MILVLTCEHAANEIPEEYIGLFKNALPVLETHRGYDPGALDMFEKLLSLANFSFVYSKSRLLIEPNRSLHHPDLFSEYTIGLSKEEKKVLIETFYLPYRDEVETAILNLIQKGERVLHLSIHSFTPVLNGVERNTDIGLLFDPSRDEEKEFCSFFKTQFKTLSNFKIRYNYPYMGKADGFTTYLRKKFPARYLGIELEMNQKFSTHNRVEPAVKNSVFNVLKNSL